MNPENIMTQEMLSNWQEHLRHREEATARQEATLQLTLEALTRGQAETHHRASGRSKAKDPDVFYGDSDRVRPFLNQLQLKFFHEPDSYPDAPAKISFAGSLLRGAAEKWFEPRLDNLEGYIEHLGSYEAFKREVLVAFGNHDEAGEAERELQTLFQGSESISVYNSKFSGLSIRLGWDNKALQSFYRRGLSSRIKDELNRRDQERLPYPAIETVATEIDCRFRARDAERQAESRLRSNNSYPGSVGARNSAGRQEPRRINVNASTPRQPAPGPDVLPAVAVMGPTPMDLDATRPRGPISDAEKKRRYDMNLCLYCGNPGHRLSDCKLRSGKSISATQIEHSYNDFDSAEAKN